MRRRLVIEIESRARHCDGCEHLEDEHICGMFAASILGGRRCPECIEAEHLGQRLIPQDLGQPDTVCRRKP